MTRKELIASMMAVDEETDHCGDDWPVVINEHNNEIDFDIKAVYQNPSGGILYLKAKRQEA